MANPRKGAAASAVVAVESSTPAPIQVVALDLGKQPPITLIPRATMVRAAQLTEQATALIKIESAAALSTADDLASTMKSMEKEIADNCKEQLAPVKTLVKAAEESVAGVLDPLLGARQALAGRVVAAKDALGVDVTTSCYASTVDDLQIMEAHKIPRTIKIPVKGGGFEEVVLMKPDEAAIKRALKAGVAVPGTYMGSKQQIGTKA